MTVKIASTAHLLHEHEPKKWRGKAANKYCTLLPLMLILLSWLCLLSLSLPLKHSFPWSLSLISQLACPLLQWDKEPLLLFSFFPPLPSSLLLSLLRFSTSHYFLTSSKFIIQLQSRKMLAWIHSFLCRYGKESSPQTTSFIMKITVQRLRKFSLIKFYPS